jgi:hypothetical protein
MTEGVFFVIEPNAQLIVEQKPASRDRKENHKDGDGRSYEPGFVTFEPKQAKD